MSDKRHWRVATATAPGSSHLKEGLPNQDAEAYRVIESGTGEVLIAAVADGAGSASRSDEGSRIAVDSAVTTIVDGIDRQPWAALYKHPAESLARDAIMRARADVEHYGRQHGIVPRELASTLIVAFACDGLITAAQVGDGAVMAFNVDSGGVTTLCEAHSGEYS